MPSHLSDFSEAYSAFDSENNGRLMTGASVWFLLYASISHASTRHCLYSHSAPSNQYTADFDVLLIIVPNRLDNMIFFSVAFFMLLILIDKFMEKFKFFLNCFCPELIAVFILPCHESNIGLLQII